MADVPVYPAFDSHAGRSAPSTAPPNIRQRLMRCPPKLKVVSSNPRRVRRSVPDKIRHVERHRFVRAALFQLAEALQKQLEPNLGVLQRRTCVVEACTRRATDSPRTRGTLSLTHETS